jgi:ketosteroid isomerase-like protein
MLRVWLALGIGVLALILSGLAVQMATAQGGVDPAAVIAGFEMARNRRDVDGALAYFAEDATISQRATNFTGKDDIRKYLEGISTRARFTVVADRHTSGNRVTWTERAAAQGPGQGTPGQGLNGAVNGSAFQVTVEAVVQDGKIRSLTYLAPSVPVRIDPSLDGRAQLPASVGLGAVLAVMLGMLLIASIGLRRPTSAASTLHGRLIQDLHGWTTARQ